MNKATLKQPAAHYQFADQVASRFALILPELVCSMSAATCEFEIMGQDKGNHNGTATRRGTGRWCHTRLATYGNKPGPRFRAAKNGKFASADNFESADVILGLFDLTIWEVLDYYGGVGENDRLHLTLCQIVTDLRPELLNSQ